MIKSFYSKYNKEIKFIFIGIWNTIFGFTIFSLLYLSFQPLFGIHYFAYTSAQILTIILGTINAYICHKYITFKSSVRGKGIVFEFFRFCMTYYFIYILDLLLLPLLVEVVHLHPIGAAAILIPVRAIISYKGHLHFSFYQGISTHPGA